MYKPALSTTRKLVTQEAIKKPGFKRGVNARLGSTGVEIRRKQAQAQSKFIVYDINRRDTPEQKFDYYMSKLNNDESNEMRRALKNKINRKTLDTDYTDPKRNKYASQNNNHQRKDSDISYFCDISAAKYDHKNTQPESMNIISREHSIQQVMSSKIKETQSLNTSQISISRRRKTSIASLDDASGGTIVHSPKNIKDSKDKNNLKVGFYNYEDKIQNSSFNKKQTAHSQQKLPIVIPTHSESSSKVQSSMYLGIQKNTKKIADMQVIQSPNMMIHVEDNQVLTRRQQLLQKIPKLQILLDKNEKFNEFYKRLCSANYSQLPTVQSTSISSSVNASPKQISARDNIISQSTQLNKELNSNTGQYFLKNLRLQKSNIKAHICKRYGKPLTEKIIQIMESYNKQMHNIEVADYLNLIQYTIFSLQQFTNGSQQSTLPNCYKFYFSLLDFGNKGFICEHDLFQLVYAVHFEKTFGQTSNNSTNNNQESDQINISVNYRDFMPSVKRNVFLETFQNDFTTIIREMERLHKSQIQSSMSNQQISFNTGTFRLKKNLAVQSLIKGKHNNQNISIGEEDMTDIMSNSTQGRSKRQKYASVQNSPQRSKKSKLQKLFDSIQQHAIQSINAAEPAPTQQSSQPISQALSSHVNAFSHSNPIFQMLKDRQHSSHSINSDSLQNCKQMSFEQLMKMPFEQDIPQLVEDFFMHMTTLSLRELVKKQGSTMVMSQFGLPNLGKQVKKSMNGAGRRSLTIPDQEDYQYSKRVFQMHRIKTLYDMETIKNLTRPFKKLSQNYHEEKDRMQIFLTKDSINANFAKVFGIHNESLALRLYNILAEGINMKRIYLPKYLFTLYPLVKGNLVDKNYFIFRLYDGDNDDSIQSRDLTDILNNVLTCPYQGEIRICTCTLYNEVHELYEQYVRKNILTYKHKKLVLDFPFFINNIQCSCLIQEFEDKLLNRNQRPSILSHDQKDQDKLTYLNKLDQNDAKDEFLLLRKKGLNQIALNVKHRYQAFYQQVMEVSATPTQPDSPADANNGSDKDDEQQQLPQTLQQHQD